MMLVASLWAGLGRALGAVLIGIVALLLALMTMQIVLRYGFNASLLWAEEACRYLMIWMSFLGMVFALERGEIAALSFASEGLPRVPALVVAAGAALASAVFCGLVAWFGWRFAGMAGQEPIPALRFLLTDLFGAAAPRAPATFWVYVALPVGMGLLMLRTLASAAMLLGAIGSGRTVSEVLSVQPQAVIE